MRGGTRRRLRPASFNCAGHMQAARRGSEAAGSAEAHFFLLRWKWRFGGLGAGNRRGPSKRGLHWPKIKQNELTCARGKKIKVVSSFVW